MVNSTLTIAMSLEAVPHSTFGMPSCDLCCGSVMVTSYLSSSYLISVSILSNLGTHLISYLIYGCGLVSS